MTNSMLKKALLKKLGISAQALSQRVQRLKKIYPMTTDDATYVIAHQNGIVLDRYLDGLTVERIRNLVIQTSSNTTEPPRVGPSGQKTNANLTRVVHIGTEFKLTDPILPPHVLSEAKEMAAIFPLLYLFENSVRELIHRIMTAEHGPEWWEMHAPPGLRGTVSKRMEEEKINSWHQRRGAPKAWGTPDLLY